MHQNIFEHSAERTATNIQNQQTADPSNENQQPYIKPSITKATMRY